MHTPFIVDTPIAWGGDYKQTLVTACCQPAIPTPHATYVFKGSEAVSANVFSGKAFFYG